MVTQLMKMSPHVINVIRYHVMSHLGTKKTQKIKALNIQSILSVCLRKSGDGSLGLILTSTKTHGNI